ncbi:ATP-binding protein [Stygiolobus azoricus]|uniref:AAA family ATPase n=1 Tax=Stygiolobus azoricus TaxID=41675 RepID=A0A650CPU3_9CREN|nr:ATP-binding protein [Stygiolobus azoricus]QGR19735.1 AAA family ATPase [Stygiolobus azoricus]
MDREKIIQALIDWNFWYKSQFTGVLRDYTDKVIQILKEGIVCDLVGVKRSGKSTIFNQVVKKLVEEGVNPFLTLIINFEDPRLAEINDGKKLFDLLNVYKEETGVKGKPYIFLDEVQRVKGWEGFVRSLIDRKEAFISVSGSTSKVNKGRVKEVLAGRHISLEVLPFSFKEFLNFKGVKIERQLDAIARSSEIKSLFQEYLKFGGFPMVVNSDVKEKVLLQLYDDIISKDVIEECSIKRSDKLRSLALFYISNVGNRVSLRRVSRALEIPLRTVERFTACIENSMLIHFVRPLSPSLSQMVKGERKVYSVDTGLSNVVGYRLNQNLGSLLENLVYLELRRRYGGESIYYYHGKNEVDFLILQQNEVTEAYQVTYTLNDEREMKGIREVMKRKKVRAYILTFDDEERIEENGVRIVKIWKWALGF